MYVEAQGREARRGDASSMASSSSAQGYVFLRCSMRVLGFALLPYYTAQVSLLYLAARVHHELHNTKQREHYAQRWHALQQQGQLPDRDT